MLDRVLRFCLENKLVVFLVTLLVAAAGIFFAPFDWRFEGIERDPVAVDAIPDIGENQQIVFTEWPGRSPQDVDDQITYPLTVSLMGLPGIKTIRSSSAFGFSSIYVIFDESEDFYWTRSRVLEKLNSLPAGTLPEGVSPALGPDATALGQVFWYTLEGRDEQGRPTGGWDPQELRTIQDWYVRYQLLSAEGVSEVASVGGFVQEYQVDVDPDAMRAFDVTLDEVFAAIRMSNVDVGARTIEINRAEYVVRGLGFIRSLDDVRQTVIKHRENVPVTVDEVATVSLGPALRRGVLDKEGAEAVGGVVVVRYGYNPLEAIRNVKQKLAEIEPGLPTKTLPDGTTSRVAIVPFYDRTQLIHETLQTLNDALVDEILVTVLVVIFMVFHLRSSLLISGLLPLAVLMCFIAMKGFGVDANVVALSGIAIAIGTMVDMGIVVCENTLKHAAEADPGESRLEVVFRASSEVGSAILTAILTTIVSFLPVFFMTGAEGKLFKPLAYTKTFALIASIVVALTIIPSFAQYLLFEKGKGRGPGARIGYVLVVLAGPVVGLAGVPALGIALAAFGLFRLFESRIPRPVVRWAERGSSVVAALIVVVLLAEHWMPLGPERGFVNHAFVAVLIFGLLGVFAVFQWAYEPILRWCLAHKLAFLTLPALLLLFGFTVWHGYDRVFAFVPEVAEEGPTAPLRRVQVWARHTFPGLGKEFMPALDEGAFLYMPTTMPHASIGESAEVLSIQDRAISAIPEVSSVVGKIGRVESPLDPAPISMVETVVNYHPEYLQDDAGRRVRFEYDEEREEFVRDAEGRLIEDPDGRPFRQWRDHIRSPADIWNEIVAAAEVPGSTTAPKLQPIETRIVMLQTGMRAPMGIKVYGDDLRKIEAFGLEIEKFLKQVPSIDPDTVFADRIVGKPYLEIDIDRRKIARYGLRIRQVQDVIEVAIGGRRITTTVEGRERYPVRVRYLRELRDDVESLEKVLVPAPDGTQIPLSQIARIRYAPGPQMIKSEDTFLVGYVLFDKRPGFAEVDVVEQAERFLESKRESGELEVPKNVRFKFTGSYENQLRATRTLRIVLPLALFLIFLLIYLQFRSVVTTFLVFTGVFVAWAGGFQMLWLYGQDWFLDFSLFGVDLRQLFQVHPINLSVAVWVGFLALFGIATDDGVIMATYLKQTFDRDRPASRQAIREAVVAAGKRRIRPCLMTTATTILALIPILTSTGRGSDVMVPMAIPSFGGMTVELVTLFVVPTLFCLVREIEFWFARRTVAASPETQR